MRCPCGFRLRKLAEDVGTTLIMLKGLALPVCGALFELLCHVSLRGSCKKILKMSSLGGGCLKAFVSVSAVRF